MTKIFSRSSFDMDFILNSLRSMSMTLALVLFAYTIPTLHMDIKTRVVLLSIAALIWVLFLAINKYHERKSKSEYEMTFVVATATMSLSYLAGFDIQQMIVFSTGIGLFLELIRQFDSGFSFDKLSKMVAALMAMIGFFAIFASLLNYSMGQITTIMHMH